MYLLSYLAKNHNDYKIHHGACDRHNSGGILLKVWVFVERVNYQQLVYNHSHHEQDHKRHLTNQIICYCNILLAVLNFRGYVPSSQRSPQIFINLFLIPLYSVKTSEHSAL